MYILQKNNRGEILERDPVGGGLQTLKSSPRGESLSRVLFPAFSKTWTTLPRLYEQRERKERDLINELR